jgi:hydrogenase 3 maturation protease
MQSQQQLLEQFDKLRGSRTLILGIGNSLKGDDGAGPLVCQRLRESGTCAELIDASTVPENYIQPVVDKAPQNLLVIDAAEFAAPPGRIRVFEPGQLGQCSFSTHTLSPRMFLDMIARQVKVNVYFVGIQPAQVDLGGTMSDEVADAVELLANTLLELFPPAG